MNVARIDLDVSKVTERAPVVVVGQGDKGGVTIEAHIRDGGATVDLDGMDARFEMRLPGGTRYFSSDDCLVSGDVITYVVDEEHVAACAGETPNAYFSIIDGQDVVYSTSRFRVRVLKAACEGTSPSEAWTNGIEEWLSDAQETLDHERSRVNAAIGAVGDISELAVPLMSADVRGGARVGDGLVVADGALSVAALTETQIGIAVSAAFE